MSFAVLSNQWRSRLTLQHAVAAISLGEQNANASHEGLAQIPPASVRQITAQSCGTRQIIFNRSKFPAAALDQFVINCRLEKSVPRVRRASVADLTTVIGTGIHATMADKGVVTLGHTVVVAGGQF